MLFLNLKWEHELFIVMTKVSEAENYENVFFLD